MIGIFQRLGIIESFTDEEIVRNNLIEINRAVRRIESLDDGWKMPHPSSDKSFRLKIIEPLSTGIHDGFCDAYGYWVNDGETWPSRPLMVKWVERHKASDTVSEG